jgi:hypothetical protein
MFLVNTSKCNGWVKENVAETDQNVRGIIKAKEVDEALKYSVKALDNVDVQNMYR